jgi:RNA polymerase sigma-70 factor (ECF subfamily)
MPDWPQIVELHGRMVWQTAWRLLNHEADVADCFQRTFVSALELSRREPIANWRPLLKRLATARALDLLRQRSRRSTRQAPLAEEGTVDSKATDPLQAAQNSELLDHLRESLAELDSRQSQVFCLACLESLSYDEIAAELGVTVNHVGVLLNRAKANLRERLSAHGPLNAADHFYEGV